MKKPYRDPRSEGPQYWLWVTRPEYYLDEDGEERRDIDPLVTTDPGGWWTCHRDTRRGDLVLLWRTMPRSDIGYLFQALSDAYPITDDPDAKPNWGYGCDYRPSHKFGVPLTVAEIKADPHLEDWTALRGRFQRQVWRIPPHIWDHLAGRLKATNPEFGDVLRSLRDSVASSQTMVLEEQLEDYLVNHLRLLEAHNFDLELLGRQVICAGLGGRIDILCHDRRSRRNVVIELKRVRASQNTFAQVTTYMGWTDDHRGSRRRTIGLVIADGFDNKFITAAKTNDNVRYIALEELELVSLAKVRTS